jgi:hypothetical protein
MLLNLNREGYDLISWRLMMIRWCRYSHEDMNRFSGTQIGLCMHDFLKDKNKHLDRSSCKVVYKYLTIHSLLDLLSSIYNVKSSIRVYNP